jgi:site-specific recombinase XerD
MPRLTKHVLDHAIVPTTHDITLIDSDVHDFGCRIWPSGRKAFFVRYRTPEGHRRRYPLGVYGIVTVDQARTQARSILAAVARGEDPAGTRQALRTAPTVADLAQRYMTEHAETKKKPGSLRPDRYNLRLHILPALGTILVQAVTREDVGALHHAMRRTPGAANRCLALCSKMFALAEQWGWRPPGSNPTRGLARYRERKRQRFLSREDLQRLGQVLAIAEREQTEMPSVVVCIRLLLLTGCRLSEVLTLQWAALDVARGIARLEDSKSGPRDVYLPPAAVALLQALPRVSPWVLPGKRHGKPLSNPHRPWYRLCAQAGLTDVRLHDLRHTYGTLAGELKVYPQVVQAVLGHQHLVTTEGYMHTASDPVQQAVVQVGAEMAHILGLG